MNAPLVLGSLVFAEFWKLQSRSFARAAWVALTALGVGVVLFMNLMGDATLEVNGAQSVLDLSVQSGVRRALFVRTFFFSQAAILVLGASALAGEYQARTLREDLLRPVPRWAVLLAKWVALAGWSAISLVLQLVVVAIVALIALGGPTELTWQNVLLAHIAAWVAEVSVAAVALMVAAITRSVQLTIAGTFLFLVIERVVGGVMSGAATFLQDVDQTPAFARTLLELTPYLPSHAWAVWQQVAAGQPPVVESWVSLVLITVVSAVVAERVFHATDVP